MALLHESPDDSHEMLGLSYSEKYNKRKKADSKRRLL